MEEKERFGDVAMRLGLVGAEQIEEALRVQREIAARGEPHRQIGRLLVEMGHLTTAQLVTVLKELAKGSA